jgi:Ca2+-binding RTX toxin-like protein
MAKLAGTNSGDLLTGTSSADSLYGYGGGDILKGGGGADYIDGGADLDLVSYIYSGAAVHIDLNNVVQQGGDAAGDQLYNIEAVTGSAYSDFLTGNGSDNIFKGGGGADAIDGRGGSDTVSYDGSGTAVQINLSYVVQSGGEAAGDWLASIENVIGSAHGDTLRGSSALNRLEGRAGDDSLFGGFDGLVDVLDGGAGRDTVDYASAPRSMTITLGEGASAGAVLNAQTLRTYSQDRRLLSFTTSPAVQEDSFVNIEDVVGTPYNDQIVYTGGVGYYEFDGGAGSDTIVLDSSRGSGASVHLDYAIGSFASYGTHRQDFPDDDYLGLSSVENVIGTDYRDFLYGHSTASYGHDTDSNVFDGRGGNDELHGLGGNDVLRGGSGNDTLYGGRGADSFDGGDGVDTVDYSSALGGEVWGFFVGVNVNLQGSATEFDGNDQNSETLVNIENVIGSDFADGLTGTNGDNLLQGRGDDDGLYGADGNDQLDGGRGSDELYGGEGDDRLDGGRGNDELFGGPDSDTFYFDFTADLSASDAPISIGYDVIHDWESGVDQIVTSHTAVMHASQVGPHTVITFDGVDGSITVANALATDFM